MFSSKGKNKITELLHQEKNTTEQQEVPSSFIVTSQKVTQPLLHQEKNTTKQQEVLSSSIVTSQKVTQPLLHPQKVQRLTLNDLPFSLNLSVQEMHLLTILFFHERTTDNNPRIMQPRLTPYSICESAGEFDPNVIKSHHVVPYKLSKICSSDETHEYSLDQNTNTDLWDKEKYLYSIDDTSQLVKIDEEVDKFSVYAVESLEDDFFGDGLSSFVDAIRGFDLFNPNDMKHLDKLLYGMASDHQSMFQKDESGLMYVHFFTDTSTYQQTPIPTLYDLFGDHVRKYCRLRFGSLIGGSTLVKLYDILNKSYYGQGTKTKRDSLSSELRKCVFTKFHHFDEHDSQQWARQMEILREYSKCNDAYMQFLAMDEKDDAYCSDAFPFPNNLEVVNMNMSMIMFLLETDEELSIYQPSFNHHCINHSSPEFQSFYNVIQKGRFYDSSKLHLVLYKIDDKTLSTKELEKYHQEETNERNLVSINGQDRIRCMGATNDSSSNVVLRKADTTDEVFFNTSFRRFIEESASLNLFSMEGMRKLDDILSSNPFWPRSYVSFFNDKGVSSKRRMISNKVANTINVFKKFKSHYSNLCQVRVGILEGIHRLFCVSSFLVDSNIDDSMKLKNRYISSEQRCIITNMNKITVKATMASQMHLLREKSMTYLREKETNVKATDLDIFSELLKSFHEITNDICNSKIWKEPTSVILPIFEKFHQYLKLESVPHKNREELSGQIYTEERNIVKSNPIVAECFRSCDNAKIFWERMNSSTRTERLSSLNIKTVGFGYFNPNNIGNYIPFQNLFGMNQRSTRRYTDQSYAIYVYENLLISLNICKYTYEAFYNKIKDTRSTYENNWKHKRRNKNGSDMGRTLDNTLISK